MKSHSEDEIEQYLRDQNFVILLADLGEKLRLRLWSYIKEVTVEFPMDRFFSQCENGNPQASAILLESLKVYDVKFEHFQALDQLKYVADIGYNFGSCLSIYNKLDYTGVVEKYSEQFEIAKSLEEFLCSNEGDSVNKNYILLYFILLCSH
jgi:hypothetical protein